MKFLNEEILISMNELECKVMNSFVRFTITQ